MQCPRCQSTLKLGERNGVEIDYCESCRGIWLDAGEIDKIIERTAKHGGSWKRWQTSWQKGTMVGANLGSL